MNQENQQNNLPREEPLFPPQNTNDLDNASPQAPFDSEPATEQQSSTQYSVPVRQSTVPSSLESSVPASADLATAPTDDTEQPAQPAVAPLNFDSEPASGTGIAQPASANPFGESQQQLPQPAKNGGKKKVVIAAIVAVLLAGALGGGAYAYTAVYQKPENVLLDAAGKALGAKSLRAKTTITTDFAYDADGTKIKFESLTFDTGVERSPRLDNNAELKLTYNDRPIDLKADVLATDAGVIYFRVSNLIDTLKSVLPAEMKLTPKAESYLKNIDGKWGTYSIEDLKSDNPKYGKIAQCTLDVYKKHKDDKKSIQELVDLYKKNQFVVVKETVKAKDGNSGYVIDIDKARSDAFDKASEQTALAKELNACDPDTASKSTDNNSSTSFDTEQTNPDKPTDPKTTTTAWISTLTHELRVLDTVTSGIDGPDSKKYTVTTHTEFDFTKGVATEAPKDSMKAKEWTQNVMKAYDDMTGTVYEAVEARAKESSAMSYAAMIAKKAEAYNVITGAYPATVADFAKQPESKLDDPSMVVATLPQDQAHIAYKKCTSDTGAQVVYRKSDGTYVANNLGRTGGNEQTVTALCK